jgi:hypothetical protein
MMVPPKSPEQGILKTREAIQIGDTLKSAISHLLTTAYATGEKVSPDSSDVA